MDCPDPKIPTPDLADEPWRRRSPRTADGEALLRWIFATPADELVAGVVQKLNQGLSYRDLVAAMLAATATPVPLETHKRAQIFSAYQLSRTLASRDELPLMYALLRLKAKLGGWVEKKPPPLADPPELAAAPLALATALGVWQPEAASMAIAVLCRAGKPELCRDTLLEYGSRNHHWIGHTTIDVVQTLRALEFGGWLRAEEVLGVLAAGICDSSVKEISDFQRNGPLAQTLSASDIIGAVDEAAALALLKLWRTSDANQGVDAAIAVLQAGGSAATVWQACRLTAAETMLRFPFESWIKFGMHAVTTNNALRHAFDTTTDKRLRMVLLLQSVAFLHRERAKCVGHAGDVQGGEWHIDALTADSPAPESLDDVFAARTNGRVAAVSAALGWLNACGDRRAFIARYRLEAMPTLLEEHQVKHPAAAFEEAGLGGPWSHELTACALSYGFEPHFPSWKAHASTVAALNQLADQPG